MSDLEEPSDRALTRLVIPVPEVSDLVVGAHVVLLDPFLALAEVDEGVLSELRDAFAELVPFAYVLGEVARFPSGVAYLTPQPVAVFRRITSTLRRDFPEISGRPTSLHGSMPHLPLGAGATDAVVTPVEVHAREAVLLEADGAVLARFAFGTAAA